MIKRELYLNSIRPFIQKPVIKVISGIRRCGKSILLQQIIEELRMNGVDERRIIYINKELFEFDEIRDYMDFNNYVTKITGASNEFFLLLVDEVQEIEGWEKAINSFFCPEEF